MYCGFVVYVRPCGLSVENCKKGVAAKGLFNFIWEVGVFVDSWNEDCGGVARGFGVNFVKL